ncbi:hypothetical protein C8R21_1442 [Nitrosospira multiformis]|jgi:mRNA-degrading endonuclease toxin of MazEF toxin-antitoxin module|uniref:Uncharacterized protein n=1 Tax=Nitrosospira multiformis TaxID=1231 RepID=A0A2T5I329_9PROT|nr:hypothetical protein C8R21_1442 [Nitrosospira multiformis]
MTGSFVFQAFRQRLVLLMADQIIASDKVRLKNQLGALSKTDMLAVEDAIL